MARELAIKIVVDNTQAKPALAATDASLQALTKSAGGAATAEQGLASASQVTGKALTVQEQETRKLLGISDETKKSTTALATETQKVATASKQAAASTKEAAEAQKLHRVEVNTMQQSLQQFDGALASVGLNIGTEVRAIGELGAASGKTAGEIGLLGTAGLTVAAAIGGWKIGRLIADLTGADKIVEDAAKSLMGWGDEAARAGAKADTLAAASKIAGREITSVSEAIKISTQWQQDHILVLNRSKDATGDTAKAVAGWRAELARVASDGNLGQLTADLKSQNFSVQELAAKYGLHSQALQMFIRDNAEAEASMKKVADLTKQLAGTEARDQLFTLRQAWNDLSVAQSEDARVIERTLAVYEPLRKQLGPGGLPLDSEILEMKFSAVTKQVKELERGGGDITKLFKPIPVETLASYEAFKAHQADILSGVQKLAAVAAEPLSALDLLAERLTAIQASQLSAGEQTRLSTAAESAYTDSLREEALANEQAYLATVKSTDAKKEAVQVQQALTFQIQAGMATAEQAAQARQSHKEAFAAAGIFVNDYGQFDQHNRLQGGVPGRASGGSVMAGQPYMVGEKGPELFTPSQSGSITPNGASGGLSVTNHFHITQPLGTPQAIARVVDDALKQQWAGQGKRVGGR